MTQSIDVQREEVLPRIVRDRRELDRAVDELGAASERLVRHVLTWTALAVGIAVILYAARRLR